jgi:hypothetical protein
MSEVPEEIVAYLSGREEERAFRIDRALAALTPRERDLVREAAVVGYVRGALAPKGEEVPPDAAILREVVGACLALPDLYPNLGRGGA